jgi:hypothetical protein
MPQEIKESSQNSLPQRRRTVYGGDGWLIFLLLLGLREAVEFESRD